jgi:hypothetical protein
MMALNSAKKGNPPVDPFTNMPIYNALDSPQDKVLKTTEWMYGQFAPPMLTRQGALGKIVQAGMNVAGQETRDRYGRVVTVPQALGRVVGINVVSPHPAQADLERGAKMQELQGQLYRGLKSSKSGAEMEDFRRRFRDEAKKITGQDEDVPGGRGGLILLPDAKEKDKTLETFYREYGLARVEHDRLNKAMRNKDRAAIAKARADMRPGAEQMIRVYSQLSKLLKTRDDLMQKGNEDGARTIEARIYRMVTAALPRERN